MTKNKGRSAAPQAITPELVRSALDCIPPDIERETWVRVLMAVKASGLSQASAQELAQGWSERGSSYEEAAFRSTWRSIKPDGAVTVGALFGIAKEHGFKFPKDASSAALPDPAQAASQAEEQRRKNQAEAERRRQLAAAAARKAATMWAAASLDAANHPYLVRKGVPAYGVRVMASGPLLVPMRDQQGQLHSLQLINADKRFLADSRKTGLLHLIGDIEGAAALLLAEGYATAASLHQATGLPVAVAFDAGNLVHVAKALRDAHPTLPLLVCGDDDRATEGKTGTNAGRKAAATAARAAQTPAGLAAAVWPAWPADAPAELTDFNDLACHAGLEAVRGQVQGACAALLAGELRAPGPRRRSGAAGGGTAPPADAADRERSSPEDSEQLAAAPEAATSVRDPFVCNDAGVWHLPIDREGNSLKPIWLCAPLQVAALTRAEDSNGWGLLLNFSDPDSNPKIWAMPAALLSGEGAEWAARLRDMGLRMAPGTKARNLIAQYLDTRTPGERVTCTDRVGWHGPVYVLPSCTLGSDPAKSYVFQSDSGMEDNFRQRGALDLWQRQVAALAAGNSRLVFALCCAFAGPVMRLVGLESGGFNLRATSSLGKTTALLVAASVWGRPSFMQRWRATGNALESIAVQHCDCLLVLDELGQLEAKEAGDVAYMLANEQEKGRSTRSGLTRKRRSWKLLFLSSGELSLAQHMATAGKTVQAGQEVRMADFPIDAGAGMGLVEMTHDLDSPESLIEAITKNAADCYGTPGRAWLEWLCDNHAAAANHLRERMEALRDGFVPEGAAQQVRRVCTRFALLAAAGELATQAGITGWTPTEAVESVRKCFNAWLAARGHTENAEEVNALRQVRAWLEKNADALLTWMHKGHEDGRPSTPLRAGFKRRIDPDTGKPIKWDASVEYVDSMSRDDATAAANSHAEYLILPEAFAREVCKGLDSDAVARVLQRRGHLVHSPGRLTNRQRLPLMPNARCFHIKPSIFADEW